MALNPRGTHDVGNSIGTLDDDVTSFLISQNQRFFVKLEKRNVL